MSLEERVIEMDWYKKLLSFYQEEEEIVEYDEPEENKSKDIKTRVAYQYPKSVPENIIRQELNQKKIHHHRSNRKNGISDIRDLLHERDKAGYKKYEERFSQENTIESKKKDDVPNHVTNLETDHHTNRQEKVYKKKPFHPTEIPSPIYGFHKRKQQEKQEEIIEFELTAFEPDNYLLGINTLDCNDPLNEYKENGTYINKMAEPDALAKLDIMDGQNENEVYSNDEKNVNDRSHIIEQEETGSPSNLAVENTESEEAFSVNKDKTILLDEEEKDKPEFSTQEEEHLTNDLSVEQGGEENEHSLVSGEDTKEFLNLKTNDSPSFQTEENVPIDPLESNTNIEEEANLIQSTVEIEKVEPFEQTTVEHSAAPQDETKQQSENVPKPKRHLPFNVLMLKQDRERLKRNEEKKAVQPVAAKRIVESQTEEDDYQFPSRSLLNKFEFTHSNDEWIEDQKAILNNTLRSFHVGAKVVDVSVGPTVTRFELSPDMGVKVSKITNLTDDLKLSLAAKDIRIEAPIPGKHTIGIEVPNKISRPVYLRDIIDQPNFIDAKSPLTAALGLDIAGKPIITDIHKMPHGLIAGATGSGKSVCINTFIISILYKAKPDEVKLLLIDPKMVELSPYNGIPHLISPVITDVKAATQALKWAVEEMERRYELFAYSGVRDVSKFNEKCESKEQKLPYIVIIIDELADLMMMAPADVEEAIARIAQKARACGIHLLIATQRPSVDVITGLIKANVPTRIAFSVSSQIDSRTIIDISGAERLLGRGDMLFVENGTGKPVRIQGAFITDEEIEKVVEHVRTQGEPNYLFEQEELIRKSDFAETDELLYDACEFAVEQGNISTSSLQRHFRIGYNRAARIIELLEEKGMISEAKGSKPRDVLMSDADLERLKEFI